VLDRRCLWLLPPAAAGAFLRCWNLGSQILLDDELHGVRAALAWELPKILTTFHVADTCIPLAALYRGLALAGVPLTERVLRAPSLAAGLALPLILPLAFRRMAGERGAVVLAWLLAVSPSLLFYARINRPYALVALLAPLAAACFWRWWRGESWRWGGAYVLAGAASSWLHLGALPFVVAPLGFAGVVLGCRWFRRETGPRPEDRGVRQVLILALLLALAVAAWLLPAWKSLVRVLGAKPKGSPDLDSVSDTLLLQAGSAYLPIAGLFWLAALGGLVALWRRGPAAALFTATLVGAQWIAVALVLRPFASQHPIVLNRYLLVALPVVLLWAATGLGTQISAPAGRLRRSVGGVSAAGFLLVLAAGSPYRTDPRLRLGPFGASTDAILFLPPPHRLAPAELSPLYRLVLEEPGTEALLHAPATPTSAQLGILALSHLHDRDVLLGVVEERLADPRLALRTLVPAEPGALEASGARFVLLDREPERLAHSARRSRRPKARPAPADEALTRAAVELEERLRESWGEPYAVDGPLRLWDLARVAPTPPPR
jgi:hypothetical protein